MEPVPKILSERSNPARWEPEGWVGPRGWPGWLGQLRETGLDVKGDCVELLHLQGPWKTWIWGQDVQIPHSRSPIVALSLSFCAPSRSILEWSNPDIPRWSSRGALANWQELRWSTNRTPKFSNILGIKCLNCSVTNMLSAKTGSSFSPSCIMYFKNDSIHHKACGLMQHSWLFLLFFLNIISLTIFSRTWVKIML